MHRWLDQLFGFSRKELQGVLVLLLILAISWMGPPLYRWLAPAPKIDMAFYEKEINSFLASAEVAKPAHKTYGDSAVGQDPAMRDAVRAPEYFPFNPNQLPASDWKRLGLSDRQVSNIKNYEAKGGSFRQKDDLRKMYTIADADFSRLEPYIQIPEKKAAAFAGPAASTDSSGRYNGQKKGWYSDSAFRKPMAKPIPVMELNTADSLSLQLLPGIGPAFASRIVRFRDRLGGFYARSQLLSVYGMDSIRYRGITDYLTVDSMLVKKIDINQATYEELNIHPFISPKQANAIVQYRKQHGAYHQLEDLLNIVVIDREFMEKAAPYLKK